MDLFTNDFCQMEMYDQYVVLTLEEHTEFDLKKATVIRQQLNHYYTQKNFVLINHRKYKQKISIDIYKQGQLNNMKGLAIVSDDDKEREIALVEQQMYGKSFVFFRTLEEAKSWAEGYF